ncbi:hypothetical protein [Clostridium sp. LIBA-8841]|uniref:hypothetical protein n=1 Tax=Clostridium sp. LIBA-8841 TaxID=2987530 RepID=UPI002AC45BDE|nr:hypothetical protein [Clostridium sp. LIBA-8841]MDZ5253752.1 hypothetical protein [Clostridium sp. LIBA-8841]
MNKKLFGMSIILIVVVFSCFYNISRNLKNNPSVEKPIHNLLNGFFKIEYGKDSLNYSDFVNNPDLVEMLTLNKKRFKSTTNKDFKIKITSIHKKENESYIVKFKTLQGQKMDTLTEYTCLIEKENNKYYINRFINNIALKDKDPVKFIEDDNLYGNYIKDLIISFSKQNQSTNN